MSDLASVLAELESKGLLSRITALTVGDVQIAIAPERPKADLFEAIKEQPRNAQEAAERAQAEYEATMYASSEGVSPNIPAPIDAARATKAALRGARSA